MITHLPATGRGLTKLSWLTSFHSFAFNTFYDPERVHFGPLRVLNDDRVEPGAGFGAHPHDNMEIVTYVLEGALEHRDSTGGHGVIRAGDVQRMRAGTGITHSEYNNSENELVHFLQIWFFPDTEGLPPGYEQKTFTRVQRMNTLLAVASPEIKGPTVHVQQDATMFLAAIEKDRALDRTIDEGRGVYVLLLAGLLDVNGRILEPGDAIALQDEPSVTMRALREAELVLFDVHL